MNKSRETDTAHEMRCTTNICTDSAGVRRSSHHITGVCFSAPVLTDIHEVQINIKRVNNSSASKPAVHGKYHCGFIRMPYMNNTKKNYFRRGEHLLLPKVIKDWLGSAWLMTSLSTTVPVRLCGGVSEALRRALGHCRCCLDICGDASSRGSCPWDICLRTVGLSIVERSAV